MIPSTIVHYLVHHHVPFFTYPHPRAPGASRLAQSLHVPGRRVAKPVVVDADGELWMTLVAACDRLDEEKLARTLGAVRIRLLSERELAAMFPDCEPGAEPPLAHLYSLPLIADESLCGQGRIAFAGGSHDDSIEMTWTDLDRLEHPRVAKIAVPMH